MRRWFYSFLVLLASLSGAYAQTGQPVEQSGNVTPGHIPVWLIDGVIADGGGATNGLISSLGLSPGPLCINSAISGPLQRLCLTVSLAGPAQLTLQNLGGATPQSLQFVINGTTYQFPFSTTGVIGPPSSTVNNLACWNNTAGTLLKDCGPAPTGGPAAWCNTALIKTGAYTVLNADKCDTITAGGSATYAITFGAVGGYDTNFNVVVYNSDANNAKQLVVPGLSNCWLWPGQSQSIFISNGAWRTSPTCAQWFLPGTTTFHVDNGAGSDSGDCLNTGSGACATYANALGLVCSNININHKQLIIQGTSGQTYNEALTLCDPPGYLNDYRIAPPILRGDPGVNPALVILHCGLSPFVSTCVTGVSSMAGWYVEGFSMVGTASSGCISADNKSLIFGGVNVYDCAGYHLSASYGATLEQRGNFTSFGAVDRDLIATKGGILIIGSAAIAFASSSSNDWIYADDNGLVDIGTPSFGGSTSQATNCLTAIKGGGINTEGVAQPCTAGNNIVSPGWLH